MEREQDINNIVKNVAGTAGASCNMIRLGARCIAEIGGRFLLLIEIEIGPPGAEIERVFIIRISAAQAAVLLRAGVMRCQIVNTIPMPAPGREVNLICAFVEGENVFLVFNIENTTDELVLVRVPLCTIVG